MKEKFFLSLVFCILSTITCEYIPSRPFYSCPKEKLLIYPCICHTETDNGISVSCNNSNIATLSIALNNLATFRTPLEKLTIYKCNIGRLYGSLLYKLNLKVLHIEDTPVESIEEHTFLGVNETLTEIQVINSKLKEFPQSFKILGMLTNLIIDGHEMTTLPKNAFSESLMVGKLSRFGVTNGSLQFSPPESLQSLKKIKYLDLHGNNLTELKRNQFKGLRDVEILDISFNHLSKLEGSHIADLTKMTRLNISNNELMEIPRGTFARNSLLVVLNISANKLMKLDQNTFRGLRFMRRLYLADNSISEIGRGTFTSLKRIGTIDLARNRIKKIDYQMFSDLNFIEILDVSENEVTEIQASSFKGLYTTIINLSKNKISKIENGAFENCNNMTLDLSYNQINTISHQAFDDISYAVLLQLSHNFLSNLSQVPLQNMTGIKVLNVSYNFITTIPKKTFPKLYELHTIDISHNSLTDIFNSVFQSLFSLRFLNMSHNNLETIKPSVFGSLPTLLELDLSYNKLNSISRGALTRLASTRNLNVKGNMLKTLFQLPISVSYLDLSNNNFEQLEPNIWPSMNSLLNLDVSYNKLGDNLVKGSFSNLLTLQKLNLNYNNIINPPWEAISELSSLQYLYLEGNNLTKISRNAFGKLPTTFELNLAWNNINNISTRAFEGLLQLLILNLTNNNLNFIPNGAFYGLVALRNLDLSNNNLTKIDNKTHGILDDCLSLEKIDLSRNKFTFLSRKMFPSNKYIPYKLKEIDLSYNLMSVLNTDITIGTSKVEILNLSHNEISDIREGVIGNLTSLKSLDLSHNKLYELNSKVHFFKLPNNISHIYLSSNFLNDLPWENIINSSHLSLLDIRNNNFEEFGPYLLQMAMKGIDIYFEGNNLRCDCFLRPLLRYFQSHLSLTSFYESIICHSPPYLANKPLYTLTEERINCPKNVITDTKKGFQEEDYDVLTDLRFRELNHKGEVYKVTWRVMKQSDIADTNIIIRDVSDPGKIIFRLTVPYFKRTLEFSPFQNVDTVLKSDASYQICLLARSSKGIVRNFYEKQCKDLSSVSTASVISYELCIYIFTCFLLHMDIY